MIIYLTPDFIPTDKEHAVMAKVIPDNGAPYFIAVNQNELSMLADELAVELRGKFGRKGMVGGSSNTPTVAPVIIEEEKTLEFADEDAMDAWGEAMFDESNFTRQERDVLKEYKGSSESFNALLRFGGGAIEEEALLNMDRAIGKSRLTDAVKVYRGIDSNAIGISDEGDLLHPSFMDKGYVSTTLHKGDAYDWAASAAEQSNGYPAILELVLVKGARAVFMDSVKIDNVGEHEILLPRNLSFNILSVEQEKIPGTDDMIWVAKAEYYG